MSTTIYSFFFFNDTATTEIYTLSLHDALPIFQSGNSSFILDIAFISLLVGAVGIITTLYTTVNERIKGSNNSNSTYRSEEHTSELQSQSNLVCRLLLEKKNYQKVPPPALIQTV